MLVIFLISFFFSLILSLCSVVYNVDLFVDGCVTMCLPKIALPVAQVFSLQKLK